jgi:hypothetical protein
MSLYRDVVTGCWFSVGSRKSHRKNVKGPFCTLLPPIISWGIGSGGTGEDAMVASVIGEGVLLKAVDSPVGGEGSRVAVRFGKVGIFCALHAVIKKSRRMRILICGSVEAFILGYDSKLNGKRK